ncbi:NUDIX hydrolase domain-like protein [Trametes punicea]|nr:NUDIX hydrolase domain-like protein [Trametes punicea]
MEVTELPPGLTYDGPLVEAASGGEENNWVHYGKVKQYTNAFVIQDDLKVLLGYKKRGFGMGLWNGFGGKVDPGETAAQAAVRELEEEAGITAPLKHCGTLFFVVEGVDTAFNINIFSAYEYEGTITESDEMRPEWFAIQESMMPPRNPLSIIDHGEKQEALPPIPLETMWADDEFWMPLMFARRHFVGRADFGADNKMRRWWFGATPA